jgi:peptidoglycan/xylan/chitin deacetylase (PgdA/CDA1 family)
MGDKWYGNVDTGIWWFATTGWQDALGKVIAWGMENGAPVYNHLFTHPDLEQTSGNDIPYQIRANDETIRKFLTQVGRADLIPKLGNIIALPYGLWPINKDSVKILLGYKNPEDKPLRAVMEAGYEYTPALMAAPYSEKFDPYHIPRMAGLPRVIRYLDENRANVMTAIECRLSLEKARASQADYISAQILLAVQSGACPAGVYALPGKLLFRADSNGVQPLQICIP